MPITGENKPGPGETELTRARYNRIAFLYDIIEALPEMIIRRWRRILLAEARGSILEVGVGTGKNLPYYHAGAHVTGIDIAENMLARARKKVPPAGVSITLCGGDVQHLEYPDNRFDSAVATFVFCSVPDPVRGLGELRRVVKPQGSIYLLEHVRIDRPFIGSLMDCLNPLLVRVTGANINRPTVRNIEQAGLRILEIDHLGLMGVVKMITAGTGKE